MTGLCACLLGSLAVGCTDASGDPVARPEPASSAAIAERAPAAVEVLAQLERAVRGRDTAPLTALAAPGSEVAAQLRSMVSNADSLDVRGFDLDFVVPGGAAWVGARRPGRVGEWTAPVDVSWRLARYDARATTVRTAAGFETHGSGVRMVSLGGPDARLPVWLAGPVRVRTSPRTLVLAARGQPVANHARRARRAVEVVRAVLPRWKGPLVVEVPRDESSLETALGAAPGSYAGIAAVATTIGDAGPDHVLVNPFVLGRLGARGAQVVLSHEAVHVATGASPALPGWLREGFADYVALRGVDLALRVTAAQAIDRVRREGAPARLPGRSALAADAADLGASYEAAWLACRVLVRRSGEAALVGLHRAVTRGESLEAALRVRTGWDAADLRAAWQARLRALAAHAP